MIQFLDIAKKLEKVALEENTLNLEIYILMWISIQVLFTEL